MAGKTVTYTIPYVDKGKVSNIDVKIFFVSHKMRREYNEILSEIVRVQQLFDEIKYMIAEISALKTEKPEGYKEQIKEIENRQQETSEKIIELSQHNLETRRTELVIDLLKDNGIKDERLIDPVSWDEHIDPSDAIGLLETAMWKDLDKKKIV